VAAEFADLSLMVGRIALPDGGTRWVVFNWGDSAIEVQIPIAGGYLLSDLRTGATIKTSQRTLKLKGRDAALLSTE
jgi:hypothetical protein